MAQSLAVFDRASGACTSSRPQSVAEAPEYCCSFCVTASDGFGAEVVAGGDADLLQEVRMTGTSKRSHRFFIAGDCKWGRAQKMFSIAVPGVMIALYQSDSDMYRNVYIVEAEQVSIRKRVVRAVVLLFLCIATNYLFHRLWSSSGQGGLSTEELIGDAVFAAVIDFFTSERKAYEIEVDDEMIHARRGIFLNKGIRHGRIRQIRDVPANLFHEAGMVISEHGRIGTFFLGGIWVPASFPQYEQIKSRAVSWRMIG